MRDTITETPLTTHLPAETLCGVPPHLEEADAVLCAVVAAIVYGRRPPVVPCVWHGFAGQGWAVPCVPT